VKVLRPRSHNQICKMQPLGNDLESKKSKMLVSSSSSSS